MTTPASYVSSDDALQYFLDFYGAAPAAWNSATADQRTYALRRATRWLDMTFNGRWKGYATQVAIDLGVEWPRSSVQDNDGNSIDESVTPEAVKQACAEVAVLDLQGDLADSIPDRIDDASLVKSITKESLAGKKSVTYLGGAMASGTKQRFPKVERILRHLIQSRSSGVTIVRS